MHSNVLLIPMQLYIFVKLLIVRANVHPHTKLLCSFQFLSLKMFNIHVIYF